MKTENRHINIQEPEGMMLLRYIKDTASNEEKSYIEAWLEADENNKRILLQTARIYYANNAMERIASRNPLIAYEKLEQRLAKRTRLYWLKRFSAAAACIIAIIGLSTLFSHRKVDSEFGDPQIITLQANAGVRTRFNLPDGTVVYLNSGSVLSYPMSYDQKERKVYLSGEAYFKVTHNEKQPFIVSTSGDQHRVRVLGTEFNIQAYGDENIISTTLVTGSVNLEVKNKSGNVSHRTLLPSEKAICNLDKEEISVIPAVLAADPDQAAVLRPRRDIRDLIVIDPGAAFLQVPSLSLFQCHNSVCHKSSSYLPSEELTCVFFGEKSWTHKYFPRRSRPFISFGSLSIRAFFVT